MHVVWMYEDGTFQYQGDWVSAPDVPGMLYVQCPENTLLVACLLDGEYIRPPFTLKWTSRFLQDGSNVDVMDPDLARELKDAMWLP